MSNYMNSEKSPLEFVAVQPKIARFSLPIPASNVLRIGQAAIICLSKRLRINEVFPRLRIL